MLNRLRASIQYRTQNIWYRNLARNYHLPGGYRRIYHYHIPKTGGTSINQMFLGLSGHPGAEVYDRISSSQPDSQGEETVQYRVSGNGKVFVGWKKSLIEEGHYFYAFSHMPAHEFQLPPQTFTLTCLRDPMKRVISRYLHTLTRSQSDTPEYYINEKKNWWFRSTFRETLENWPDEHLLHQLVMFSPNYDVDEAVERIQQVNAVLFTEEMAAGVARLAQTLDLDLQSRHVRKTQQQFTPTETDLQLLHERLAPEIRMYERVRKALAG